MKTIKKELPVQLTEEEKATKSGEIARIVTTLDDMRERSTELRSSSKVLSKALRDGHELRLVECREEPEERQNTMRLIRTDTGEVVSTRAMTPQERNLKLFEVKPRAGKKAEPKPEAKP